MVNQVDRFVANNRRIMEWIALEDQMLLFFAAKEKEGEKEKRHGLKTPGSKFRYVKTL